MRWLASVVLLGVATAAGAEEIVQSFRGGVLDEQVFRKQGPMPDDYISFDEHGLRIRFPPGSAPRQPVGISWRARISGDFAVTADCEVLETAAPSSGSGVGVELYLMFDQPPTGDASKRDGVPFSRMLRPGDMTPVVVFQVRTGAGAERRSKGYTIVPSKSPSNRVRLRLARTGPTLIASSAEGEQTAFQEIARYEIGLSDVRMARFAAIPGGNTNAKLDLRLLEMKLEGANIAWEVARPAAVAPPAAHASAPAPVTERRSRALYLAVAVGLGLCLAMVVALWQRRRATGRP